MQNLAEYKQLLKTEIGRNIIEHFEQGQDVLIKDLQEIYYKQEPEARVIEGKKEVETSGSNYRKFTLSSKAAHEAPQEFVQDILPSEEESHIIKPKYLPSEDVIKFNTEILYDFYIISLICENEDLFKEEYYLAFRKFFSSLIKNSSYLAWSSIDDDKCYLNLGGSVDLSMNLFQKFLADYEYFFQLLSDTPFLTNKIEEFSNNPFAEEMVEDYIDVSIKNHGYFEQFKGMFAFIKSLLNLKNNSLFFLCELLHLVDYSDRPAIIPKKFHLPIITFLLKNNTSSPLNESQINYQLIDSHLISIVIRQLKFPPVKITQRSYYSDFAKKTQTIEQKDNVVSFSNFRAFHHSYEEIKKKFNVPKITIDKAPQEIHSETKKVVIQQENVDELKLNTAEQSVPQEIEFLEAAPLPPAEMMNAGKVIEDTNLRDDEPLIPPSRDTLFEPIPTNGEKHTFLIEKIKKHKEKIREEKTSLLCFLIGPERWNHKEETLTLLKNKLEEDKQQLKSSEGSIIEHIKTNYPKAFTGFFSHHTLELAQEVQTALTPKVKE